MGHDLGLIHREGWLEGLLEANRLRRDDVHQWAALDAWECLGIDRLGVFLAAKYEPAPGSAQGLVGGCGDKVSMADRAGVQAGGNQSRNVGNVGQQQRTHPAGTDLITGTWQDGRIGFVRGMRAAQAAYSVKVFGTAGIVEHSAGGAFPELLTEVVKFFRTGKPPVDEATTIEIFAFMEAADESKRLGGTPVSIEETIAKHSNP